MHYWLSHIKIILQRWFLRLPSDCADEMLEAILIVLIGDPYMMYGLEKRWLWTVSVEYIHGGRVILAMEQWTGISIPKS